MHFSLCNSSFCFFSLNEFKQLLRLLDVCILSFCLRLGKKHFPYKNAKYNFFFALLLELSSSIYITTLKMI